MKKFTVMQVNTSCGVGSTGKIAVSISELLSENNIDNYILFSSATNGYNLGISCCSSIYTKVQSLKSHILGNYGFNSVSETKKIIQEMDIHSPNVVLLHNIHGHDCNLEMLFTYFKKNKTKLFWTFHDCWAFTAYCSYFTFNKCTRWKTGCSNCPKVKSTSFFFDRSVSIYQKKKELFSDLDLTIITPSQWLANLVKMSFLQKYPVKVVHNGIDLNLFTSIKSDFRIKNGIRDDQFVVLGVALGWGNRKGLDVFVTLSKILGPQFRIVLVGVDKDICKMIPSNIISIRRTQNQHELAEIYSAADVFVNPTREDNFPTVNLEALACGTPVITFNTGGSPESIDESCGFVVAVDDIDILKTQIVETCSNHIFSSEACLKRAQKFRDKDKFQLYIDMIKQNI